MSERGIRYKCYKCETKFYDLGRPQPICPSCGEDQNNKEAKAIPAQKRKRSFFKKEPDIHLYSEESEELLGTEEEEARADAYDDKEHDEDVHEDIAHDDIAHDDVAHDEDAS